MPDSTFTRYDSSFLLILCVKVVELGNIKLQYFRLVFHVPAAEAWRIDPTAFQWRPYEEAIATQPFPIFGVAKLGRRVCCKQMFLFKIQTKLLMLRTIISININFDSILNKVDPIIITLIVCCTKLTPCCHPSKLGLQKFLASFTDCVYRFTTYTYQEDFRGESLRAQANLTRASAAVHARRSCTAAHSIILINSIQLAYVRVLYP